MAAVSGKATGHKLLATIIIVFGIPIMDVVNDSVSNTSTCYVRLLEPEPE